MTAEPAPTVYPPQHPLPALTTYELRNYRRDLEGALAALPEAAPVRVQLTAQLTAVLAEQESRAKIAAAQ
jgi:hypothetical protein